jgi:hypothetical protein
MGVLDVLDAGGRTRGLLPPSSCAPDSMTMVTCLTPAPGISGVVLSTYPSLAALRAAYVAQVSSLNSGRFAAGHSGCGVPEPATAGEAGWGHQGGQPASFAVAPTAAGKGAGPRAAGRVFCTMTAGAQEDMVWTQDDGRLLGWVAGGPHQEVWAWWSAVHAGIALPG